MSTTIYTQLTKEQKEELDVLTSQYVQACENFTVAEATKKALNATIKELFSQYGIKNFLTEDGNNFTVTIQHKTSFNEDRLLAFCKKTGIPDLVKTKEYVDMDVLESALYNKQVNPEEIKEYQVKKPDVVTLKYTQKKTLNE